MNRDRKGHSILKFPISYVVLDLKTTGLDPYCDSIIAVRAKRYLEEKEVASFSETVRIEHYIQQGKSLPAVLSQLRHFIGDVPVIGYHISFLIDFLYDAYEEQFSEPFSNDYFDLKEAIRALRKRPDNETLDEVCSNLKITGLNSDQEFSEVSKAATLYQMVRRRFSPVAEEAKERLMEIRTRSPFYNSLCVFTGKLQRMERKEAISLLSKAGGIHAERVTMKTNYLILGNHDYCSKISDGKSNKQIRAEQLQGKGSDMQIISENVYYDLIAEK